MTRERRLDTGVRKNIPLDALIAGQLFVRQTFLNEAWLLAGEDYWTGIESAAKRTPSIKEACFQFKIIGKEPQEMAIIILRSLGFSLGPDIPEDVYWGYVDRLAGGLFESYPDDYKAKHMLPVGSQ